MKKIKGGFILTARQIRTSEIWDKPAWWYKVWHYIIMEVKWKEDKRTGLQRGQGWFTYDKIFHDCNLYREHVRRQSIDSVVSMLKLTTQVTTRKTTRGFIITAENYDYFQNPDNYSTDTETDTPADSKPIANRQQTDTIIKEGIRRDKKEKLTALLKQGGEYKIRTHLQYIVCSYKSLKGIATDDRQWDADSFKRCSAPAAGILRAFNKDHKKAAAWMKVKAEEFNTKGMSWTLETLERWAQDSKGDRNDDNYSQVDVVEET